MDKQVSAWITIRKGKLDGLQRQAAAITRPTNGIDRMPGGRRSRRAEP
jgi:hypothetical protein